MKELSLGVIGCGQLARAMHLPNIANLRGVRLRVCCDVDTESLAACQRDYPSVEIERDFRKVASDPRIDALIVATGEGFRIPIYEAAAAAGKPVYTEKPLAASLSDARRAVEIWTRSGLPFCVGHNRRCSPAVVRAAQIVHAHMDAPSPNLWRFHRPGSESIDVKGQDGVPGLLIRINDDWRSWKNVHLEGENARYGLLLSEMTHFVDLARLFLRSEARRVFAMHNGILNHVVGIEFESGAMASIAMFSNGSMGYPKELLEVVGGGAVVVCDHMLEVRTAGIPGQSAIEKFPFLNDRHPEAGHEGGLHGWLQKRRAAEATAVETGNPMEQFTAEPDKGHARMLAEFVREIRGERGPVSPVRDAYEATRICLAAVRSAREERPVPLSEIH